MRSKRPRPIEIPGFLVAADALVACKACGAKEGKPCRPTGKKDRGEPWPPGFVHFTRRLTRLLLTGKDPLNREKHEQDALKILVGR